jgi:hypothetical protein
VADQYIGKAFAGLTDAEKQNFDTLLAAFQQAKQTFDTAQSALHTFTDQMRKKYALAPTVPFATGDLVALRASLQEEVDRRAAAAALALENATPEEKAKYAAWVAAGRPVQQLDRNRDRA